MTDVNLLGKVYNLASLTEKLYIWRALGAREGNGMFRSYLRFEPRQFAPVALRHFAPVLFIYS